jgi:hypothetical protein
MPRYQVRLQVEVEIETDNYLDADIRDVRAQALQGFADHLGIGDLSRQIHEIRALVPGCFRARATSPRAVGVWNMPHQWGEGADGTPQEAPDGHADPGPLGPD